MSLQRQFEGPDVRALLDEICATYGPEPTIAKAETFRTGGVLGFFAREHYRLVVDESAQPLAAASAPAPSPAPAATPAPAAAAAPAADRVDPFAFLADATEDDTVVARPAATPPAPAAPTFETVLQGVARLVDPPAAAPVAWPALTDADNDEVPTDESLGLYRPPAVGAPQAITDLLASAAAAAAAPEPAPATVGTFSDVFAPKGTDCEPAKPVAVLRFKTPPAPAPTRSQPARPQPVRQPARQAAAAPEAAADGAPSALAGRLERVGLHPDDIAGVERATASGYPVEAALLEVMDAYPAPPRLPRRPGSLVVVIGPGRRASAEAARIAGEAGTDPAGVAYATERRPLRPTPEELLIHSADDALELAPGHRRGRVGVVAVDASVGTPATWARHVVDALRPTQVIAVVDAMYKSEDIADWIEAVGGVDALIVDNVAATVSPARILELGVPVSRIGDAPSSPARWVAALADRLHAGGPDHRDAAAAHDGAEPEAEPADLELTGAAPWDRRWA